MTYKEGICSCHGLPRLIIHKSKKLCAAGVSELRRSKVKPLKKFPLKKKYNPRKATCSGEVTLNHIAVYCRFFRVKPSERFTLPCEFNCGSTMSEVHHISARGMGGDPQGKKDTIGNLMGVCAACHRKCTEELISRADQVSAHAARIQSL